MRTLLRNVPLLFLLSSLAVAAPGPKQKILFDCDLAGDVDDAFALGLVLASPEFEVLGIVMDHGHTPGRARVACRMLYELGLGHIPVLVGRHTPGVVGDDKGLAGPSNQFIWGEGFEKIKPLEANAADFIIETLKKHPREVTLFTVGPVCNIQDVLRKDPGALKLAKRVVSMFGSFYMGYDAGPRPAAEWNVRADVAAAQAFVGAGANPLFAGLDVTTFVKLNEEQRTRLLYRQSPLTDSLCGLYSLWRYESYAKPDPTMFDAVAVGMVLWPELFTTRRAHVKVIEGGFTVIDESQPPNCEIGLTIQTDEFIRRMMDRLLKQNLMRPPGS
jgi:inosine-uridine nucleoside N-ribohydrolase